ncbi:MAG: 2-(1,2-epoxy-1,2-dihydrophenyl)acetyl-CoA isomerase PaaG [Myxococcales bacterium]|nr:2-(1,2-epoxy-1,2-dihydrophenyl)acetyl-CoA isomerase PaaG [Myxococcales bacterium]
MSQSILLEIEARHERAAVATITLNRPDKLNSFDGPMLTQLSRALDEIDEACSRAEAPVRAVVLTGAGRGFCAGQDLGDPQFPLAPGSDLSAPIERHYNPLARRIRGMAVPTVAAVNGVAAGAGANLALLFDIVVAARSAKFVQPFNRLGVVPDTGGTHTLPRLVGEARARALMLLGVPVTAEQACSWGMIWEVVDDEALADHARGLAQKLADMPTAGLAHTKRALDASCGNTFEEQLILERDRQRLAGETDDFREGVAAFLEKRKPQFTGR